MSTCVCWFVFLLSRWRERLCTTKLYAASSFFFLCLFIQLLILHTLSSTSMYTHMPLLLSSYERWLDSVLISLTFTHSKRIFIYIAYITNDVVVNVFFFALLLFSLSLLMSILTCSDSYKREEEIQQASAARG